MNTASRVDSLLAEWKEQGLTKAEIVWKLAEACLGWPYIFGAVGEECTPATRRKYANNYSKSKPEEAQAILNRCQVCRQSNPKIDCSGCSFFPGGKTRSYDCRGFTRWCLGKVGIVLQGAGCTSQWNNAANWEEKGRIEDLPPGVLACFFHADGSVMQHTGFIKDGVTVHCSGTVKEEKPSKKITHYAIPKGLSGKIPVTYPTIRRGSRGDDVVRAQKRLQELGYDIGSMGADGIFGARTEAAVIQFQRDWGLEQDGVIGPETWKILMSAPAREKFYSVTIPHLEKTQAEAMRLAYPNATIKEE